MKNQEAVYQKYIDDLELFADENTEARFVALQLLKMHSEVAQRNDVVVLELGVDRGQSTKIFLNAIDGKKSSHVVSIDIRDCKNVADSKNWTFLQEDSSNVSEIVRSIPLLKDGIDVLYVDSLHTHDHVQKELYGWFPYLKKNGVVYFDDVDSGPYLLGQRKDSLGTEIANRNIFEFIEATFRANMDQCNLSVSYGSTGLARLQKISGVGSELQNPAYLKRRKSNFYWKFGSYIFRKRQYKHDLKTSDSFLIDVTKY